MKIWIDLMIATRNGRPADALSHPLRLYIVRNMMHKKCNVKIQHCLGIPLPRYPSIWLLCGRRIIWEPAAEMKSAMK